MKDANVERDVIIPLNVEAPNLKHQQPNNNQSPMIKTSRKHNLLGSLEYADSE
jgi:hypothetical protein